MIFYPMDLVVVFLSMVSFSYALPVPEQVILLDTVQDHWRGWKTNSGKYSGWRTQNIPPDGDKVYGICMVHRIDNDNWLYSPIIPTGEAHSIIIETYFSMRNCRNYPDPNRLKTCEDTIHLLTYETNEIRESTNQNNRLFKPTSVLFPQNKWTKGNNEQPLMNLHKVSVKVKSLGIRIGYRDTGSCTMIKRIRIYYLACPSVINSFTSFPRTVARHSYELVNVLGTCVKGAVQKSENAEQLQNRFCQANGLWHDMGTMNCDCGPGFTASTDWKACIPCASGTYKPIAGSIRCSYCPKYSQSESGMSNCECEKGYFRKISTDKSFHKMLCLRLPRAPKNLKADITDGSKVILKWDFLNDIDINEYDPVDYYHVSCASCPTKELQFIPGINVTSSSVTIFGLTFGQTYLFYVTSMASISNYSRNMLINPSRSSVRFYIPKSNPIIIESVKVVRQLNGTYLITWKNPESKSPIEMYLIQIKHIFNLNKSKFGTNYEYIFTRNSHFLYKTNKRSIEIFARLRFKSDGEWSDLSPDAQSNSVLQENFSKESASEANKSIFLWLPNLDVVFLCITSAVIIVIFLAVSILLMRKYIYFNMKRSNCRKMKESNFLDNTKSSYASISASSLSRAKSYFYLSSIDNLASSTPKVLNEIQSDLIMMKTLIKTSKYYDVYNGSIKQPRRLAMNVTLNVFNVDLEDEIKRRMLEDCREVSQFQHENVINIFGFCTTNVPQMILEEFMANGCLNSFLQINSEKLTRSQLLEFLRNIASGMEYLSERKFIHKKLSTHNIFVDSSFVCKLSICLLNWWEDSKDKLEPKSNNGNKNNDSIRWLAPEIYLENSYSTSSDVWAYGVTMWEVFSLGENPYWDWAPSTIYKIILEGYRLPPPKNCYHNLHLLMLSCWILEPSLRPTFSIILKNLDQFKNDAEKSMSPGDSINRSNDEVKFIESIQDSMTTSLLRTKGKRNASLEDINNDKFQSLKLKQSSLFNKRSCSSITNAPIELGTVLSNIYASTNPLKPHINSPNLKENNFPDSKSTDFPIKSRLTGSKINLHNWLSDINMRKYKRLFMKNGYSSRSKLAYISIADLTDMGIKKASEIQILMNNAHQLRNDYSI